MKNCLKNPAVAFGGGHPNLFLKTRWQKGIRFFLVRNVLEIPKAGFKGACNRNYTPLQRNQNCHRLTSCCALRFGPPSTLFFFLHQAICKSQVLPLSGDHSSWPRWRHRERCVGTAFDPLPASSTTRWPSCWPPSSMTLALTSHPPGPGAPGGPRVPGFSRLVTGPLRPSCHHRGPAVVYGRSRQIFKFQYPDLRCFFLYFIFYLTTHFSVWKDCTLPIPNFFSASFAFFYSHFLFAYIWISAEASGGFP